MAETKMNVKLLAHTQLSEGYHSEIEDYTPLTENDGKVVSLAAIRTCYSANKPSEIPIKEGAKYFIENAKDGAGGSEADRLIRQIMASKHVSTVEHLTFTFAIEGVSRALLAQLTRHRVGFSFSVQSQRYVRFGSGDRSGGFDYVVPESISEGEKTAKFTTPFGREIDLTPLEIFERAMNDMQYAYDLLRKAGVPAEDARAVLPNAAATNLVMTANLRALLDFYAKRQPGKGAQGEIAQLSEVLKSAVIEVEPWTSQFFEGA